MEARDQGMLDLYREFGIDLYIYDSSTDEVTANLISAYREQGYDNIYHVKLPSEIHLDTKLVYLLSGKGRDKQYDYIWPCRDSTWFERSTLTRVEEIIDEEYDIIVLNPENPFNEYYPEHIDKSYDDANQFFHEVGWYLTGMMCRIFRRETLIDQADWIYLFEKYRVWIENGTFFEIGFIFEQISKLEKFHGIVLSKKVYFFDSPLKGINSHWRGQELEVWGTCWPQTVKLLPDCYKNKTDIIKKKAHLNEIGIMKRLNMIGKLDVVAFFSFYSKWNILTKIPRWKIFLISIGVYKWKESINRVKRKFRGGTMGIPGELLKKLCNPNYSFQLQEDIYDRFIFPWEAVKPGSNIIIYGGGVVGKIFLQQLAKASYCTVVAICDRNPKNTGIKECQVIDIHGLSMLDIDTYDTVLIAIEKEGIAEGIRMDLETAGIPAEKIRWVNPAVQL